MRPSSGLDEDVGIDMARVAECFGASVPTDDEVRRARVRLDGGRAPRASSRRRILVAALAQGFVLGVVSLAAAAWVAQRVTAPPAEAPSVGVEERASNAPGHRARRGSPAAESMPAPLPPGDAPMLAFDDVTGASEQPIVPPPPAKGAPNAPFVPGAGAAPAAKPFGGVAELERRDGPWATVAAALERGDRAAADRTLASLAGSGDPGTRDAAELTRAQLAVAAGTGELFRGALERLSREGATALVRRRASELIARLPRR